MSKFLKIEMIDIHGEPKDYMLLPMAHVLRNPTIKLYESKCIYCGNITLAQRKTKYCSNKCTVYAKRENLKLKVDTAKAHTDSYHRLYNWEVADMRIYAENLRFFKR